MMASCGVLKLVSLMLVASMVVVMMPSNGPKAVEAAVTCSEVVNRLMPCVSYVTNGGPLPNACCIGVKTLYGETHTSGDRQSVCKCIQSALKGITNSSSSLGQAASLPDKCGLQIPYKTSPSTDCNEVQ